MCMMKMPKMPDMPDPKLPQQALSTEKPAALQIGNGVAKDQNRSRRKLRITKDKAGVQTPSGGTTSGMM